MVKGVLDHVLQEIKWAFHVLRKNKKRTFLHKNFFLQLVESRDLPSKSVPDTGSSQGYRGRKFWVKYRTVAFNIYSCSNNFSPKIKKKKHEAKSHFTVNTHILISRTIIIKNHESWPLPKRRFTRERNAMSHSTENRKGNSRFTKIPFITLTPVKDYFDLCFIRG